MGFTFDFIFHVRCICIVSCLCFRTISAYFLVTFLYYNVYHHYLLPYVRYLHLHTCNKPCHYGTQCYSYSVVTIHGAYNAVSYVKSIV